MTRKKSGEAVIRTSDPRTQVPRGASRWYLGLEGSWYQLSSYLYIVSAPFRNTSTRTLRIFRLTVKNAMTNPPMAIDIRVENRRNEAALWRESWVIVFHIKIQHECPIRIR